MSTHQGFRAATVAVVFMAGAASWEMRGRASALEVELSIEGCDAEVVEIADCTASPMDCEAPDDCSGSALACGSPELEDIVSMLEACVEPSGLSAGGFHTLFAGASDGGVMGPGVRLLIEVIPVLDDGEPAMGEWYLGASGGEEGQGALWGEDPPLERDLLIDHMHSGVFTPSDNGPDACDVDIDLPTGLQAGIYRFGLRAGRLLIGYDVCFGDSVHGFVGRSAEGAILWGPLREETLWLRPAGSVPSSDGFVACDVPEEGPTTALAPDPDGTGACAEVDPLEYPCEVSVHVNEGPDATTVCGVALDLMPPEITSFSACQAGEQTRVEWDAASGFDAFDIEIDGRVVARKDSAARAADLTGPDMAGCAVAVLGVVFHPAVEAGIGYRSLPRTLESMSFRRGDANSDGVVTISDPIRILNVLFLGEGNLLCLDAADADDSGDVVLTDAIRVLNVLFTAEGEDIPLPGTDMCGPDPTDDALPCCCTECQ